MTDPLRDRLDRAAVELERSHVDRETRERIAALILAGDERAPTHETARRLVASLAPEELALLVADWLDAQSMI